MAGQHAVTATDPTIWQAATGVLSAMYVFMTWQYQKLVGRVDESEKTHVTRDEFNGVIERQRKEFATVTGDLSQEIKDLGKSIHSRQDDLMQFLMEHIAGFKGS
ncbi:MAG: hypothetical protein KAS32_23450 [Candidatus Peribacteraceae bacterium]|nr:hypothetical protein [Candidatus Peribacteraceae bacterium]